MSDVDNQFNELTISDDQIELDFSDKLLKIDKKESAVIEKPSLTATRWLPFQRTITPSEVQVVGMNEVNIGYYRAQQQELREQLLECECSFIISEQDVISALKKLNSHKSPGPDNVSAKVLKECAEGFIYQHIFQRTIEEHTIPSIWKASIIVPVPKKSNPCVLNDYRPVALTSIAMKCLEKLVLRQIMVHTEAKLDEHQFAYRHGKSVEDAVLTLLHRIYKHVDQLNSYVRILFIDYSSAFNTIQPHIMIRKLLELNVPADICLWVLNFLSDRTQTVRIGNKHSSVLTLNTGAPQGCVLSPVLLILYTNTLLLQLYSTQFLDIAYK